MGPPDGVANIVPLLGSLQYEPSIILRGKNLEGPSGVLYQLQNLD